MGRTGITYDQVAATADALLAETSSATLKAVRDRLGTGGMGTIHRHLTAWNANRPKEPAAPVELPIELARGLSNWVTQAATAARADTEERLVQSQSEAQELSRAGEQLEAERDALLDQIISLTTERDQAEATAVERAKELERLAKEVERERALAGAAQIETAQSKLKAEAQTEQLTDLRAGGARLNVALKTEGQARSEAEKKAAVLEAERDAARREAGEDRARIKVLQTHLDKAHQDTEAVRAASEKAVAAERAMTEKEREAARAAAVENASLKAQLTAAEKTIARLEPPKK
jgi:SMC interacting uncharacterized protein involved in chromosome segregation